jgi:hypothetical protein
MPAFTSNLVMINISLVSSGVKVCDMAELLSTATITATGLLCKAFLNSGLCSITVSNLHILLDALRNDERRRHGQGVVTGLSCNSLWSPSAYTRVVANHISTSVFRASHADIHAETALQTRRSTRVGNTPGKTLLEL